VVRKTISRESSIETLQRRIASEFFLCRLNINLFGVSPALVAEKKDDFGGALQNLCREQERAENLVGPS
jgi:hypothetical protein